MFNYPTTQANLSVDFSFTPKWLYLGLMLLFLCHPFSANADDGKIFNGLLCKSANNVKMSYGFKGGIKNIDPIFYSTVVCPVVRDSISSLKIAKYVSVSVDDRNFESYKDFNCSWRAIQYKGGLSVYRSLSRYTGTGKRTLSRNLPYCSGSCIGGSHHSYLLVCNVPQRYGSSGYSNLMSYKVIEEN